MKCPNPNYTKIPLTPVEISLRDEIGASLEKEDVCRIGTVIEELSEKSEHYRRVIEEKEQTLIFNHGCAAEKGAEYILRSLSNKKNKK
jgi:YidC/Oxa1 family membrane protein insertase